jgi:hypothetical protein
MAFAASFPRHNSEDLRRFLVAVDTHLVTPARMVVIGGSAVALGYGVQQTTNDVDTFETDLTHINVAAEKARAETGLDIPVGNSTVADLPYHFEDRLQQILTELRNLSVFVPDRHDLVLSKIVRAGEHDFQAIDELHTLQPLDFDTLLTRYLEEMDHVVTDMKVLKQKFLICVRSLFGEIDEQRANRAIERHRAGK